MSMSVFHDPGDAAVVDIVLVHGLRGHAEETWTAGSCCWPRDLLKRDIHDARIMSWAWDSSVAHATSYSSHLTLHQHAETLLLDLQDLRVEHQEVR